MDPTDAAFSAPDVLMGEPPAGAPLEGSLFAEAPVEGGPLWGPLLGPLCTLLVLTGGAAAAVAAGALRKRRPSLVAKVNIESFATDYPFGGYLYIS